MPVHFYLRGFQNRDNPISPEKCTIGVPRSGIFDLLGVMPDINIPKWSSSIVFFGKNMKFEKNQFSNIFFGPGSPRTRFLKVFEKRLIESLQLA